MHEAKWSDAVPDITTRDKLVSAFNVFAEITKVYSMNPVEEILRNLSSPLPRHELLSALRTKGQELMKQHRKYYEHCTQVELLVLWIWSLEGVQIDRFCGWQDAPRGRLLTFFKFPKPVKECAMRIWKKVHKRREDFEKIEEIHDSNAGKPLDNIEGIVKREVLIPA
eukprot:gene17660-biopygen10697